MTTLTVELTPEQQRKLEALARQRGYDTPADYVRALIEQAAELIEQSYFWTEEWQIGEREADEDIAAGRVETFDTMDDLLADLMSDDE